MKSTDLLKRLLLIEQGLSMTSTMHQVLQARRELQGLKAEVVKQLEEQPRLKAVKSGNC